MTSPFTASTSARLGLWRAEIRDVELQIARPVPGVLLERERHVKGRAMSRYEVFAACGPPGNPSHHLALLAKRHLEMTFLEDPRTVYDFHPACVEHRPGIAGAKRCKHRQLRGHPFADPIK